ncbi:MAG: LysR family transcriptional regulator [Rhodobacterales bacterium]|nr:LysR family transcriptional regulator [Rhodobacterales bacterium]
MSAYRSLPPLSTLIGFEAAARLQSFSRAAEELHITQSAISHQVRVLEEHLGQPLFRRIGRRIELVDAGRDFLITARTALEEVRHGVRRLNAYSKPGSVIVMMPGALATGWFIPRLASLRASHPWVDPWVHTSDDSHVPEEAEIDIVLGPVPWADPGAESVVLAEDRQIPLCAPSLAATLPDLTDAQRLDDAPLLHDETLNDWQSWFSEAGSARTEFARGYNFSDTGQMLQAAILGLGVCLASERLAHQHLAEGRLVRPVAKALGRRSLLFASAWTRNLSRPPVAALWTWIEQESRTPLAE